MRRPAGRSGRLLLAARRRWQRLGHTTKRRSSHANLELSPRLFTLTHALLSRLSTTCGSSPSPVSFASSPPRLATHRDPLRAALDRSANTAYPAVVGRIACLYDSAVLRVHSPQAQGVLNLSTADPALVLPPCFHGIFFCANLKSESDSVIRSLKSIHLSFEAA